MSTKINDVIVEASTVDHSACTACTFTFGGIDLSTMTRTDIATSTMESTAVTTCTVDSTPIGATTPSTARFITPASNDNSQNAATTAWALLGFAASFGTNSGYIQFPSWLGGFILQWKEGSVSSTPGATQTVSFPITFPTACRSVMVSTHNASPTDANVSFWQLISFGASSCSVFLMRNADHAFDAISPIVWAVGN